MEGLLITRNRGQGPAATSSGKATRVRKKWKTAFAFNPESTKP
jgi:hypothetical protein